MITNLININISLLAGLLLYRLLCTGDTFFRLRRFLLPGIVFFSLLLPWLSLVKVQHLSSAPFSPGVAHAVLSEVVVSPDLPRHVGAMPVLPFLYISGVVVFGLRFVFEMGSLCHLLLRCPLRRMPSGLCYRELPDGFGPFSFFGILTMSKSSLAAGHLEHIVRHECEHIRQWHSLDVLLMHVVCILCRFNPFVRWAGRELRRLHEYLADKNALRKSPSRKEYRLALLANTSFMAIATIQNNFNVSPLKQRIKMMNRKRTNSLWLLKYLLFVPITAIALPACSSGKGNDTPVADTIALSHPQPRPTPPLSPLPTCGMTARPMLRPPNPKRRRANPRGLHQKWPGWEKRKSRS